jgi:hypothetical protein
MSLNDLQHRFRLLCVLSVSSQSKVFTRTETCVMRAWQPLPSHCPLQSVVTHGVSGKLVIGLFSATHHTCTRADPGQWFCNTPKFLDRHAALTLQKILPYRVYDYSFKYCQST